jgi:hypothetical protein
MCAHMYIWDLTIEINGLTFCAENDNTGELLNVRSCDYVIQQFCVNQTLRFSLCLCSKCFIGAEFCLFLYLSVKNMGYKLSGLRFNITFFSEIGKNATNIYEVVQYVYWKGTKSRPQVFVVVKHSYYWRVTPMFYLHLLIHVIYIMGQVREVSCSIDQGTGGWTSFLPRLGGTLFDTRW